MRGHLVSVRPKIIAPHKDGHSSVSDSSNPGNVAILVPMYRTTLTSAEEFSLRNTLKILGGQHDVFVIGPNKLHASLKRYKAAAKLDFAISLYSDGFFESIKGYNALMMSRHFYKSFAQYDYVLIVQTDALVFTDQLRDWCDRGYSYVGAPWFGSDATHGQSKEFLGVGNGGFSLRRVEDCIRFLSKPRRVPNTMLDQYFTGKLNAAQWLNRWIHRYVLSYNFTPLLPRVSEDVFWGILVPQCCPNFTVPTAEDAVAFSFETQPSYLYSLNHAQLPFGCHAWEKYEPEFWRQVLGERGIELP